MSKKIFGVGFHKTGTTSFADLMTKLSYKTCHGGGELRGHLGNKKVKLDLQTGNYKDIIGFAKNYEFLNDTPWFYLYKELDELYPESKFILVVRDEQEWISSCSRYFKKTSTPFRIWIYGEGSPVGNEEIYLKKYRQHNMEVIAYFKKRPNDLLVLNLSDAGFNEKLAKFIGVASTTLELPHLNRSK
jgi:hypothetical protein